MTLKRGAPQAANPFPLTETTPQKRTRREDYWRPRQLQLQRDDERRDALQQEQQALRRTGIPSKQDQEHGRNERKGS